MRAAAWWHAVPEEPQGKKPPKRKKEKERVSRAMALADGITPDMPPIDPELIFIFEALMEAGPASPAGMGEGPLTWADLDAWQRVTGIDLMPWQSKLIRRLSAEYLAESRKATDHDAPPPWTREVTPENKAKLARHIKSVLRG